MSAPAPAAPAQIAWAGGGEAVLVSIGPDAVVLRSTVAAPPGARVEGTARAGEGDGEVAIRVKVHACKREAHGVFLIRGRPIDLTREARERLTGWVPPPET